MCETGRNCLRMRVIINLSKNFDIIISIPKSFIEWQIALAYKISNASAVSGHGIQHIH